MWLCFQNNIHLLFLPPHTSHVLQPLDLSIFGPLKKAYKKEVGNLIGFTDLTTVGKRQFILCYAKARTAGLTESNIRSGWSGTGLWPIHMTRPLMSRLLLENSNKPPSTPQNSDITRISSFEITAEHILDQSGVVWSTPTKGSDLQDQLAKFNRLGNATTTQRLLFRKVQKGYEEKDFQLAIAQRKIKALEIVVEAQRAKKRKRVETSPNSKFANIEAIRKAQMEAGDLVNTFSESDESDLPSEAGSCIVVESGRVEEAVEEGGSISGDGN